MHFPALLVTLLGFSVSASPINPIISLDSSVPNDLEKRELDERQSASVVRNDLRNLPCRAVTVIFARGTSEAGNVGALVGPQLFNELGAIIGHGNVAAQGVDYPADVAGFLIGGSPSGARTLASLVSLAVSKCPNTDIVLGGYSQGAQVVYRGAAQLTPALASRINAVVLFGNPNDGDPVPNISGDRVRSFCNRGDLICEGTAIVLLPHLTYAEDADDAARFIAARVSV